MPMPPVDKPGSAHVVVMLQSPRDAAARAIVYRRRLRGRPPERALRSVGLIGTLLVHLVFLFGAVLGSAYELKPAPESPQQALQVRLIDKPEPPPPPPVRGTPPKQVGPTRRGNAAVRRPVSRAQAVMPSPPQPPVAIPAPDLPVIALTAPPATIKLAPVAAPTPPLSLPRPQPSPELKPVPPAGEPPQIALDTPPAPAPTPPRFQPEPVRKPQPEGNRPLMPPPSLAMPELPAQPPPTVARPSIALDTRVPTRDVPPSTAARPAAAPAPPTPPLEGIPLPAQPAPQVNLQPQLSVAAPSVPRERPQVQVPTIQLDQPQLTAIPRASPGPVAPPLPPAPKLDLPTVVAPVPSQPSVARPQLSATPPSTTASEAAVQPSPPASVPAAVASNADERAAADASAASRASAAVDEVSRAPMASPLGQDLAVPGQPEGVQRSDTAAASTRLSAAPAQGQGEGRQGKPQPGAAQGEAQGRLGGYIELKPRGDTQILSHGTPNIGYRPTRFEGDWTPEGESSIDTALRRAVEKTTVKHTFHLPRGVRVKCAISPLFPVALFGCGSGDPPPKPVDAKVYQRMHLAPANPLVTPPPAATVASVPAAPVTLDNGAQCAAARVSGGPLPPGCEPATAPARQPMQAPAPASSSWVPASDQFR